jgi:quercetin dioxygenase-like cupin family protein
MTDDMRRSNTSNGGVGDGAGSGSATGSAAGSGSASGNGERPVAASANAAAPGVDLPAVIAGLLASPEWATEDRSSVSVLQTSLLRVVVTALHAGATLHNDHPDEVMTIQGLQGEAEIAVNESGTRLPEGGLVAVPGGVPWRLAATTDAIVLLTVARPTDTPASVRSS